MKKTIIAFLLICVTCCESLAGNLLWTGNNWECVLCDDGTVRQLVFDGRDTVKFFSESGNAGPSFYCVKDGQTEIARWEKAGGMEFVGRIEDIECRMKYTEHKGQPSFKLTLTNRGKSEFCPEKAGIRLGINTYMDNYPSWLDKHFPTFMRNETSHFFGYLQSPEGHSIGVISDRPVASWSVDYNLGYQDPPPHWFMGHRIESLNIDLLNALPLPTHNPQNLFRLKKGEKKTWIVSLINLPTLDGFEEKVSALTGAPVFKISRTSYEPSEEASFELVGKRGRIRIKDDRGKRIPVTVSGAQGCSRTVRFTLPHTGLYTVTARSKGKRAEAVLSARPTWRWTLEQARKAALKYNQKASSHIESWYGYHSAFLAARYFPDDSLDSRLADRFEYLFALLHDTTAMAPKYFQRRIQNTSGTIGLLVDKYQAFGDIRDLERASALADWLITNYQRDDGAYTNGKVVYTSVIYVAKSILELTLLERELGAKDIRWAAAADRHFASARKAVDQLVASQGSFQTEGQMTFEDGMVSCSALQVGMLALMLDDPQERGRYIQEMLKILSSHECLAQLRVPDARRRGGTMRFWEAQYDVQMLPNMFNSPHGWSGWRCYATYYAYLLTGDERWLRETFNACGAFANLVDCHSGELRWAFVLDPYLKVRQACSPDPAVGFDSLSFGNPHPDLYQTREFVIGEQYVGMVSDWQTVNTQDNDVHELFKCIGETVLTNAYVLEREDGSLAGYNCRVSREGERIVVTPSEEQISRLHCNLRTAAAVCFRGTESRLGENFFGWIAGGPF